jgi:hypothetical protein
MAKEGLIMFVIGIGGQLQMGKDTIADRLAEKLNCDQLNLDTSCDKNPKWLRAAFASNVKKVYCDTFGVDMDFVEKWKVIPEPPPGFEMNVRQALQFIGDGFRKIKGTIWLDLTFRDKSKPKIISDVRYVNEFLRVKKEGGMNILVGRPDKINNDPNGSESQIKPYIEYCLDTFPYEEKFVNFTNMNWEQVRRNASGGLYQYPPDLMDRFDVFIRNDGTKEQLIEIIDSKLVPFARSYVFDFPTEEKENKCLISQ